MIRRDEARPRWSTAILVAGLAAATIAGAGCRSTSATAGDRDADAGRLADPAARRAERPVRPEETVTFDTAVTRIGDAMLASKAAAGRGGGVGVLTVLVDDAQRPEERAIREELRHALNKRYLGRARFVGSDGLGDVEPDELATVVDLRARVTLPEDSPSATDTWIRVLFEPVEPGGTARDVSVVISSASAADAAPLSRRN